MSASHRTAPLLPLFLTGQVVATPGALRLMAELNVMPLTLLARHITGDWSDMSQEDQELNRLAALQGDRVFSSFLIDPSRQTKVWCITEWDRSVTTFLLPSEY